MPEQKPEPRARLADLQKRAGQKLAKSDALKLAQVRIADMFATAMEQQQRESQRAIAQIALEQQARREEESRQIDDAIRWVENKWGEQPCPYCQHSEWQVDAPLELAVSDDEVMAPTFPVMCGNCGHTTFVNAIRAGLLPESDEQDEEVGE